MTTELHISGVLPSSLYGATIERLSSYCERGEAFTSNEEVFARSAGESNGAGNAGAGLQLRVKALRTRSSGDAAQWSLQVNGRPEPVRTAPRAQQYGVTELLVEDGSDPRSFAHALGYGKSLFTLRRRGVVFHRANVSIELFQLYEADNSSAPLDAASYAVSVTTRFTAAPRTGAGTPGNAAGAAASGPAAASQEVREAALGALEDVARLLKGLVDLRRID